MAKNINVTPHKQYTVLNITPTTKHSLCVLCSNTIVEAAKRRKLWKYGVKTDTCRLLENLLDLEFEKNEITEVACRSCVEKFTTLSKKKSDHLVSLEKTKHYLKEKYGVNREKRGLSVDHSENSLRRSKASKSLFSNDSAVKPDSIIKNDDSSQGVWVLCQYPSLGLHKKTKVANKFQPLAKALMQDNEDHILDMFLTADGILDKLLVEVTDIMSKELSEYCSTKINSVLRYEKLDSLKQFTWKKFDEELQSNTPIFWKFVTTTISSKKKLPSNFDKTNRAGYLSAAAKILSLQNSDMSVLRRINSVILKNGHARKRAFKRLIKTNDCMSYTTTNKMLVQFGGSFDKLLLSWKQDLEKGVATERQITQDIFVTECDKAIIDPTNSTEFQKSQSLINKLKCELKNIRDELHPGYSFTGDNVDIVVNPRQMTINRQNKDHHLYQANAYKNRISGNHLNDERALGDIKTVPYHTFLPSEDDDKKLGDDFETLISQVWVKYLAFLEPYENVIESNIPHMYSKEMSSKTQKVRLGVWKKNEQKLEDMQELCKILHEYVPFNNTDNHDEESIMQNPVKCLSGGDYLTHERQKSALELHADGRTPGKRLEGLISKMEDFHAQAEWQKVIWKHLHSTHSAKEIGTLYSCRNIIEARNVTKDPHDNFYAASELLDKFTLAYLLVGAFQHFGMQDLDAQPTINKYNGDMTDKKAKKRYLSQQVSKFVQSHVMPKIPELSLAGAAFNADLSCSICKKQYQRPKALENHERKVHGLGEDYQREETKINADRIYNYTKTTLSLCMIRWNHNSAIKFGDGERVLRLYKYMYLYFKVSGCPKYAYGFLETLAQIQCLLSPRLAHRLTWNRFVNTRGQVNTNFPMDLDIEHDNLLFKDNFFTFHGDVTNDTLTRASKSHFVVAEILGEFDKNTKTYKPSGKHSKVNTSDDIKLLVNKLKGKDLFVQRPGRFFKSYPDIEENPLTSLDMTNFRDWLRKCFQKFSQKHYYNS